MLTVEANQPTVPAALVLAAKARVMDQPAIAVPAVAAHTGQLVIVLAVPKTCIRTSVVYTKTFPTNLLGS